MTRVLVVGDVRIYRDGLAEVLARETGVEIVGTAAGQAEVDDGVRKLRPDVVLLDTAMAGAIETIRSVATMGTGAQVVALGVPEREREVLDCAEAGVAGYVTRAASLADLVAAVAGVARGEVLCSPRMAAALLRRVAALAAERTPAAEALLTRRELEIVELIDAGLSNKEIARRLSIEPATVKNHVHNILEKLKVDRRAQAAALVRTRLRTGAAH